MVECARVNAAAWASSPNKRLPRSKQQGMDQKSKLVHQPGRKQLAHHVAAAVRQQVAAVLSLERAHGVGQIALERTTVLPVQAYRGRCVATCLRTGKTGGYAAFASHVSSIPGYQRDSVERQSSFKTRVRTCSKR